METFGDREWLTAHHRFIQVSMHSTWWWEISTMLAHWCTKIRNVALKKRDRCLLLLAVAEILASHCRAPSYSFTLRLPWGHQNSAIGARLFIEQAMKFSWPALCGFTNHFITTNEGCVSCRHPFNHHSINGIFAEKTVKLNRINRVLSHNSISPRNYGCLQALVTSTYCSRIMTKPITAIPPCINTTWEMTALHDPMRHKTYLESLAESTASLQTQTYTKFLGSFSGSW